MSYQGFKEQIISTIRSTIQVEYYQELQLRVLCVVDDLLRQKSSESIESYRSCIFEAIRLSEYPSLLVGLHGLVDQVYREIKDGEESLYNII